MTVDRVANIRTAATALDEAMETTVKSGAQTSSLAEIRQAFAAFSTARDRLKKQQPASNTRLAAADKALTSKFANIHQQLGQHIRALELHIRRLRRARLVQLLGLFLAILVSVAAFSLALWFFWPQIIAGLDTLFTPNPPAPSSTISTITAPSSGVP